MRFIKRKLDEAEKLLNVFIIDLEARGFDVKVFDKNKIKRRFGKGLYKRWKEALNILRYRKLIIIFDEKITKTSWPSFNYPDRIAVNLAQALDEKLFQGAEEEFYQLETALSEIKSS